MALQTIVAAFDFSDPSAHALRWAHELARAAHARLEIVHAHPELYEGRGAPELGLPWPSPGQEERYLRFLDQEVRNAAQTLLGDTDVALSVHIVRGDPTKQLLASAERLHADMIVVGANGKGRVQRVMLGSVSDQLLRTSTLPITVVH